MNRRLEQSYLGDDQNSTTEAYIEMIVMDYYRDGGEMQKRSCFESYGNGSGRKADTKWKIDVTITLTITDQSLTRSVHICTLLNQRLY